MKILILTVTAGGGHNSTARAIADYFEKSGIECKVLDTIERINHNLQKTVSEGYLLVAKNAKYAFGEFYRLAEKRKQTASGNSPARISGKLVSKRLREYIDIFDPDVIIYTHIFAGIILDGIKQEYGIRAKTIGILTDFVFHPYWEETLRLDYVVTAGKGLDYQALKKGFRREQVLPFGIPVNPKFRERVKKEEARLKLGLDPHKNTLLLMGGSMGYGRMAANAQLLDDIGDADAFQIICVCGSNAKAKEEIDALTFKKNLINFGFTDKIELLMDASDCIVTKPGGLTVSESLAKALPIIIINPIPGQEDRNTEFLLNHGAAVAVTDTLPLDEAVWIVMNDNDRREQMRKAAELLGHPDSTEKICEFARKIGVENCRFNITASPQKPLIAPTVSDENKDKTESTDETNEIKDDGDINASVRETELI